MMMMITVLLPLLSYITFHADCASELLTASCHPSYDPTAHDSSLAHSFVVQLGSYLMYVT